MTVYLDSSAIMKLLIDEPAAPALREWLFARGPEPAATNVIGVVEAQRAAARTGHAERLAAASVLQHVVQLDITRLTVERAAALPPPEVRALDALHVASASELADLTALVTYDRRMAEAASAYGLPVESPGG